MGNTGINRGTGNKGQVRVIYRSHSPTKKLPSTLTYHKKKKKMVLKNALV